MLPDIHLTTGQAHFEICAAMMVETEPWTTLGFNYEQCLTAFEGPCKEIYIAEFEGAIVGFVVLQVCGSFRGYIQTVCVHINYRGRGFGNYMLRFCEDRITKISPNIFICVSAFNTRAIKLYEQFGFKQIGVLENFVKQGFNELLLRKTSGPIKGFKAS